MARAHGKVILLGEHAVVYGHPALAAALALGVSATARRALDVDGEALLVPAWGLDSRREPAVARAFAALLAALGQPGPWEVVAEADVPPRAGLGSSAALMVAAARAVAPGISDDEAERAALEGERVFHGNPSGIDVALAARGGAGLFRRASGLERRAMPPLRLAIGLSGEARDTGARVADVARRRASRPDTDVRLAALGQLALAGAGAWTAGRWDELGRLFDLAQEHLRALGLSSPGLDALCARARTAGALGAKLTGAGGGGAVIALGNEEAVVDAWRAAGFQALITEIG